MNPPDIIYYDGMNMAHERGEGELAFTDEERYVRCAGWQLIATAPRDNDIQLYCMETGEQFVASWMTDSNREFGAWIFARSLADGISFQVKSPTHWMPLPDAPEAVE